MAKKKTETTYAIDFGLNLDVGAERIGFPMSAGLVEVKKSKTGEGDPQWFSKLQPGDSIAFRVWNQTLSKTEPRLVGFRATWVDPSRFNELANPFTEETANPIVFSGAEIQSVQGSPAASSVYPRNRGGWIFGDPATASPPLGQSFTFAEGASSAGIYYLRARLEVVIDEKIMRVYQWDPEVVVGAGGGEPPPK